MPVDTAGVLGEPCSGTPGEQNCSKDDNQGQGYRETIGGLRASATFHNGRAEGGKSVNSDEVCWCCGCDSHSYAETKRNNQILVLSARAISGGLPHLLTGLKKISLSRSGWL